MIKRLISVPDADLADGIRRFGFRRWYQRELLSGHAHLVLLLLSTVGVMACLEVMSSLKASERLLNALYVLLCVGVGIWSLRRYLAILMRAEAIANQANCPTCGTYGRLKLVADHPGLQRTDVRCSKCAHPWTIES